MRLRGKIAIVVGAGQTPGTTIGNGRATAILFAREGARVLLVDRDGASLAETRNRIEAEGGVASSFEADVTRSEDSASFVECCVERYGRIDVLQNNVGVNGGDGPLPELSEETWRALLDVNLTGVFLTCKHVLPVMREQGSGVILNVSSIAAVCSTRISAYKASKAGLNALSHALAMGNAQYGIRVNVVMPGLIDTPAAVDAPAAATRTNPEEIRRKRNVAVPLRGGMGSAWDVAHASLFLASDEAKFITAVTLPVDGGQSARIG